MKLYEINLAIQDLIASAVDDETGEVLVDTDELTEQLEALELERQDVLKYLAKMVLNNRAEIDGIKAEEARLRERRAHFERETERLMSVLDRECNGTKTDLDVATVNYRHTKSVDVQDSKTAVEWLESNGHKECLKYTEPSVLKSNVKKVLESGESVPGCEVVESLSCSLK